jgi:hypothetical protein
MFPTLGEFSPIGSPPYAHFATRFRTAIREIGFVEGTSKARGLGLLLADLFSNSASCPM